MLLFLQFPSNGSNQIQIPALSVDGLSTPVVLSPGPQKPWFAIQFICLLPWWFAHSPANKTLRTTNERWDTPWQVLLRVGRSLCSNDDSTRGVRSQLSFTIGWQSSPLLGFMVVFHRLFALLFFPLPFIWSSTVIYLFWMFLGASYDVHSGMLRLWIWNSEISLYFLISHRNITSYGPDEVTDSRHEMPFTDGALLSQKLLSFCENRKHAFEIWQIKVQDYFFFAITKTQISF